MTSAERVRTSTYMNWAKTQSGARFNLCNSGLSSLTLKDLNVSLDDLELTDGGYGYQPLLQAIGSRYHVNTDCVVTAAGTSFANHLAIAALIDPGDEVLFEQPAYEPMLATTQFLGGRVRRFSRRFEDGFQLNVEEVQKQVTANTKLVVVTNLHNPSSAMTEDQALKQIGAIAKRVGARVLVDEVYLESLFEPEPRTAFHLGEEFVVTNSLTKVFGLSGLRCGWIFAEPTLARRMWLLNDLFASTPVHCGERLSVIAFDQIDELAKRSKSILDKNRSLMNEFLDSRMDLELVRPNRGTVMFPRLKNGTSDELCALLKEKYETSVVPGGFFEMPAHFRVGLAGDSDELREGLERLGKALDEVNG